MLILPIVSLSSFEKKSLSVTQKSFGAIQSVAKWTVPLGSHNAIVIWIPESQPCVLFFIFFNWGHISVAMLWSRKLCQSPCIRIFNYLDFSSWYDFCGVWQVFLYHPMLLFRFAASAWNEQISAVIGFVHAIDRSIFRVQTHYGMGTPPWPCVPI